MKAFTPVAAFLLCLLLTSGGKANTLEQSLRTEIEKLSNPGVLDGYRVRVLSRRIYYCVPLEVASILDSHTEADLVSALVALQGTAAERDESLINNWIQIVKSHVRSVRGLTDASYSLPVWKDDHP